MNQNKVYTHVSLFSGAGGLDIGLEQAGFHTVWANDFNHDACETHRLWSNATVVEGDIGKVDYDIIPDCDIASFGFPCQGFSLSGPRKIDDSRNVLYRHCVKLVEKKQPKLFLAENVKGLLTLGGGKIKDAIIADFESKGYVVSINLVNAADYHVPEDRQRILLVGIRKDLAEKYGVEFKVPAPFPDRISIRQALESLAPAAEDEICKEAYSSRYMSRNRKRGWDSVSFTILAACEDYVRKNKQLAEESMSKKELLSVIEDWLDNHRDFEAAMSKTEVDIKHHIGEYANYASLSTYVVRKMLKDRGLIINFSERQLLKVWKERKKKDTNTVENTRYETLASTLESLVKAGVDVQLEMPEEEKTAKPEPDPEEEKPQFDKRIPYTVIRSSRLSKPNDVRYIVVNLNDKDQVLDDASGYGYKSISAAQKGYGYKCRNLTKYGEVKHSSKPKTNIPVSQSRQLSFGDF